MVELLVGNWIQFWDNAFVHNLSTELTSTCLPPISCFNQLKYNKKNWFSTVFGKSCNNKIFKNMYLL